MPGGFASWSELLRLQQRMNTAAARITNGRRSAGANSGFAGIVADPTTRQLQVYWKGEPPANLVADQPGHRRRPRCCPPRTHSGN